MLSGMCDLLAADRGFVLATLKEYGLKLALENHPETNARQMLDQLGPIKDDCLGTAVDTGWYATRGYDVVRAIQELEGRIFHIHLKNVLPGAEHINCGYTKGIVPLEACVRMPSSRPVSRAFTALKIMFSITTPTTSFAKAACWCDSGWNNSYSQRRIKMNTKVGTCPDSWGVWFPNDPKQIPWQRCLDEIAETGYKWVELGPFGYFPTDPKVLRPELEKRGLIPVGQAIDEFALEDPSVWHETEKTVRASGELLAALGAEYFVIIDLPYSDLATGESRRPRQAG